MDIPGRGLYSFPQFLYFLKITFSSTHEFLIGPRILVLMLLISVIVLNPHLNVKLPTNETQTSLDKCCIWDLHYIFKSIYRQMVWWFASSPLHFIFVENRGVYIFEE